MKISPITVPDGQFQAFSVEQITDNSVTDFDLFLQVADHVVLYGARGYKWYRRELTDLLKHGISRFYIRPEDTKRASMYQRLTLLPVINRTQAPRERIVSIEQIGAEFTKCLYSGEITESCVDKARTLSSSLIDCIVEDKACVQALSGLGDHDYYTFVHSMRVAAYTVSIAIEMGLTDHQRLEELALGGIFHDIGKKDIPIELINKTGALSDQEWSQVRSHPELGLSAIDESILSYVPREIILHHHEKLDGSGYPHGLDQSSMLTEVQIACLADIFDALTSTRSYQQKRSRYEALDFIRHNLLGTKLSKEPFQALISCLVAE
jgi:HD-GYP domain-containing protein (c-di-GMP phosphodiesterase class II)